MNLLRDTVWQRRGTSWIWDGEALASLCIATEARVPQEVWSLRQLLRATPDWPRDLPGNSGNAVVVAGLDAALDLLTPHDAEDLLSGTIKNAVLSFQSAFQDQALPGARARLRIQPATDAVTWLCPPHHGTATLDFGRITWGETTDYPQQIILRDNGAPAGLFHRRIA